MRLDSREGADIASEGILMCPMAPRTLRLRRTTRTSERRANSSERGYDGRWRKFRDTWLAQQFAAGNVWCAWCGKVLDCGSSGIHVDHKRVHNGDFELMYDPDNLAAMHAACHSAKTIACDGGFGRGKLRYVGGTS